MRAKTNALKSRVDRLYRRTHRFWSHADVVVLARYYEEKLDECEKSDNFDENFRKFKELKAANPASPCPEQLEILKIEEGLSWKGRLEMVRELGENYPHGGWWRKRYAEFLLEQVAEAKAFFNTRKEKAGK